MSPKTSRLSTFTNMPDATLYGSSAENAKCVYTMFVCSGQRNCCIPVWGVQYMHLPVWGVQYMHLPVWGVQYMHLPVWGVQYMHLPVWGVQYMHPCMGCTVYASLYGVYSICIPVCKVYASVL